MQKINGQINDDLRWYSKIFLCKLKLDYFIYYFKYLYQSAIFLVYCKLFFCPLTKWEIQLEEQDTGHSTFTCQMVTKK